MKRAYMNMLMKMKAERIESFYKRPSHFDMSGMYLMLIGGMQKPKYTQRQCRKEAEMMKLHRATMEKWALLSSH